MFVNKISRFWIVGLALVLGISTAMAGAPGIEVTNPRIRLLPGDLPLAGYFDVHNTGKKTVSLTGVSSADFGMVMMHRSMHKNGEASMMMVDKIDIAPGKTVQFAPGGYHLMLMNRKKNIKVGDKILIDLEFGTGEKTAVQFKVGDAGTE